jgi:hypothetical protein
LLIGFLSTESLLCGITEELIREGFMYPASSASFKVTDESKANVPVFFVNVISMREDNGYCVSRVTVQVYVSQDVMLEFSEHPIFGAVELWLSARTTNHKSTYLNLKGVSKSMQPVAN